MQRSVTRKGSRFSGDRPQARERPWLPHPRLIEDDYTITDAVVVGTLLNSLLRHGDRVTIAYTDATGTVQQVAVTLAAGPAA